MLRLQKKKNDVGLVWEKKKKKEIILTLFLTSLKLYCYFIKWDSKINKVNFCSIKLLNTSMGEVKDKEISSKICKFTTKWCIAGIFRAFQQMRQNYKAQLQIVWHENKGIKPPGDKGA